MNLFISIENKILLKKQPLIEQPVDDDTKTRKGKKCLVCKYIYY